MDQTQVPPQPTQPPTSQILTPVQAYVTPPVEEPEPPSFGKYVVIILVLLSILFVGGLYALGWYKAQLDATMPSTPIQRQ